MWTKNKVSIVMIVVPIVIFIVMIGYQDGWSVNFFEALVAILGLISMFIGATNIWFSFWKDE